ncbi:MAG: HAMP domain-containing sensor histidine kinase [Chitinivibrionales bacterium]|nr:HAMP domain-containing sensor histidine kinase [Chitinivibrionales bacterium]
MHIPDLQLFADIEQHAQTLSNRYEWTDFETWNTLAINFQKARSEDPNALFNAGYSITKSQTPSFQVLFLQIVPSRILIKSIGKHMKENINKNLLTSAKLDLKTGTLDLYYEPFDKTQYSSQICEFNKGGTLATLEFKGFKNIKIEEVTCAAKGDAKACHLHISWKTVPTLFFKILNFISFRSSDPHTILAHMEESHNKLQDQYNEIRSINLKLENAYGQLKSAYRELEEASALKEVGSSTAMINHEIKNYLFTLAGYSSSLEEDIDTNNAPKESAKAINEVTKKLISFSEQLNDFSKAKMSGKKDPFNVPECLQKTIETHFSEKEKKDRIKVLGAMPEHIIAGDAQKIEQVFVNALNNSLQANAKNITITFSQKGYALNISIEDDGDGCSQQTMDNLFKAFYTTKGRGSHGLGMSIVRSIIENHGGTISVVSKNLKNDGEHGLMMNLNFSLYISSGAS